MDFSPLTHTNSHTSKLHTLMSYLLMADCRGCAVKVSLRRFLFFHIGRLNNGMSFKTLLCQHWQKNVHCSQGDQCTFAHGNEELLERVKQPDYKTTLCLKWKKKGRCHLGGSCTFAHGADDRRVQVDLAWL